MTSQSTIKPVSSQERIMLLDTLRGFALFGILMVNMPLFNNPHTIMMGDYSIWTDALSKSSTWFIRFFFEGKFYVLFSLLFGMGFHLFMQKINENRKVLTVFRIRLMYLLLFGILHVVLLWYGDILVWYALFGFIITWLQKKSNRSLIKWAIGFMLIPILVTAAFTASMFMAMRIPEAAEGMLEGFEQSRAHMQAMTDKAYALYPTGSFVEIINFRLREYSQLLWGVLFFYPNVLSWFLIGMLLMRKGYLRNPEAHKPFFKRLLMISLPIGLSASWVYAHFSPQVDQFDVSWINLFSLTASIVGGFFMAMTYLSLIVMLSQIGLFTRIRRLMAAVGRMALTNYLMQSVVAGFLFFSYGFGLYGKVSPFQGILITIAIYLVQVMWSYYWLKAYRYGPMEWLWRSLTYRKLMPMKRQS